MMDRGVEAVEEPRDAARALLATSCAFGGVCVCPCSLCTEASLVKASPESIVCAADDRNGWIPAGSAPHSEWRISKGGLLAFGDVSSATDWLA